MHNKINEAYRIIRCQPIVLIGSINQLAQTFSDLAFNKPSFPATDQKNVEIARLKDSSNIKEDEQCLKVHQLLR
jgi:hypothetical protein